MNTSEKEQAEWLVIDLGGSIVSPVSPISFGGQQESANGHRQIGGPDSVFSVKILSFLHRWLLEDERRHLGLVVGGGAPARSYQQAFTAARKNLQEQFPEYLPEMLESRESSLGNSLDELGVQATHLNGEYLRLLALCLLDRQGQLLVRQPLLRSYDNLPAVSQLGRIVIGGGWKPGFSTDYDAVLLAEHLAARRLLCLSNIAQIYDADPKQNPQAKPVANLDWNRYRKMIVREWQPGASLPFDPVASAHAEKIGLELVFADGRNLENLACILAGKNFIGTVVR